MTNDKQEYALGVDGKPLKDANGEPIPADAFDFEPSDRWLKQAEKDVASGKFAEVEKEIFKDKK